MSELIGEFCGSTAPKVNAKVEEARGGVLFIDEVQNLMS
jgi:DNA-binding NtrC family response regulator